MKLRVEDGRRCSLREVVALLILVDSSISQVCALPSSQQSREQEKDSSLRGALGP